MRKWRAVGLVIISNYLYNKGMGYEWNEVKRRINQAKHGVDFAAICDFDWETVVTRPDTRHAEPRTIAYGLINARLHVLIFTERGENIRVISLRKANSREKEEYDQTQG